MNWKGEKNAMEVSGLLCGLGNIILFSVAIATQQLELSIIKTHDKIDSHQMSPIITNYHQLS